MTTVYIINDQKNSNLHKVTLEDLKFCAPDAKVDLVDQPKDPLDLLKNLQDLNLEDGDIVCFSGLAVRQTTWNALQIAQERQWNIMPGQIVDHRCVAIPQGTFYFRRAQESNNHPGIPYIMLIGDSAGAKNSWSNVQDFATEDIWHAYLPDTLTAYHWLSAAASLDRSWITPTWFPVVDLSIRDLDLIPTMYSTNHWSDWIAFYPANGNFKLENHAQVHPVWFDHSTKPLEHWTHV